MQKLKDRWGIESNWQLFVILLVFSVTGSTAAKLAGPVVEMVGLSKDMGGFLFWTIRILLIFPLYQMFLVFFGWLFGEYHFFWKMEKKMLRRLKLGFLIKD